MIIWRNKLLLQHQFRTTAAAAPSSSNAIQNDKIASVSFEDEAAVPVISVAAPTSDGFSLGSSSAIFLEKSAAKATKQAAKASLNSKGLLMDNNGTRHEGRKIAALVAVVRNERTSQQLTVHPFDSRGATPIFGYFTICFEG